jgi:hypothetical protein
LKNRGAVPVSVTVIDWVALVVPTATGPKLADRAENVATGAVVGGGGVPPPPPPPWDAVAPPVVLARMTTTAATEAAMRDRYMQQAAIRRGCRAIGPWS